MCIRDRFNVVSTIILLPFSALLEKLAILTVKDDSVDVEVKADNNEVGPVSYTHLDVYKRQTLQYGKMQ